MDAIVRLDFRLACLEIAKQIALHAEETSAVAHLAEEYWQWLIKLESDPSEQKTAYADGEIPF